MLSPQTLTYGAKGSNLLDLVEKAKTLSSVESLEKVAFSVPKFELISTELYKKFKAQGNIDKDISELYHKLKRETTLLNGSYMIRSSAVYSEDGDLLTGAGIYESHKVAGSCVEFSTSYSKSQCYKSPEEAFLMAIYDIFERVMYPNAVEYRKQNNIPNEEMALVIQEFVTYEEDTYGMTEIKLGYANSVHKHHPEFMKITSGDIGFIINKEAFKQNKPDIEVFYTPTDFINFGEQPSSKIAQMIITLEELYGYPIQVEYIYNFVSYDEPKIHLLQVRPLPKNFSEKKIQTFPDEEFIFEGYGIGVGEYVGEILMKSSHNSEGVLVVSDSYRLSMEDISGVLPKKGGVLVVNPQEYWHAHIETLCAEKDDLICCYHKGTKQDPNREFKENRDWSLMEKLGKYEGKIKLVSDGLIARAYLV